MAFDEWSWVYVLLSLFKHLLRIDYILHSPELNSTDYFSPDSLKVYHNCGDEVAIKE